MKKAFMAVLFVVVPVFAQEPSAVVSPSAAIGNWQGAWTSNSPRQTSDAMELQVTTDDGKQVSGRVRFTTSASPPCSQEWATFGGTKNDAGVIRVEVGIGGRCRKVAMILSIDSGKNVMRGTYDTPAFPR